MGKLKLEGENTESINDINKCKNGVDVMKLKLKKSVWVVLGILLVIFLFGLNVYISNKAVDRCVSSGQTITVCNDLRK